MNMKHFQKTSGNLYDGGFLKDVTDELAVNSGENPKNQEDRIALAEAAKEPDLARRVIRLQKILDVDRFKPLEFDGSGIARLTGWESQVDFGQPELVRSSEPGDFPVLVISTSNGSSIGSWRTKVWLPKGQYRLVTRMKTVAIAADPGDPRGGAGLRLARNRPEKYALGTSDWHEIGYDFSIDEVLAEIQLACEFRGAEGKALFDLSSIRLNRRTKSTE